MIIQTIVFSICFTFFSFFFNCFFSLSSAATYSSFFSFRVSLKLATWNWFFDFHAARLKLNCALNNFLKLKIKIFCWSSFFFLQHSLEFYFWVIISWRKKSFAETTLEIFQVAVAFGSYTKRKIQHLFTLRVCSRRRICLNIFSGEC